MVGKDDVSTRLHQDHVSCCRYDILFLVVVNCVGAEVPVSFDHFNGACSDNQS